MNSEYKKSFNSSIVLIGDFQPSIFHPDYLLQKEAITEEEYKELIKIKKDEDIFVSNNMASLETDLFVIQVQPNRLVLSSKNELYERMLDVFINLFDNLGDLPVKAYGINISFHLLVKDKEELREFGQYFSPWEKWGSFLKDEKSYTSGISSLSGRKTTEYGCINLKIESSTQYLSGGVYFNFNFHHDPQKLQKQYFFMHEIIEEINTSFDKYRNLVDMYTSQIIKGFNER